MWIVGALSFLIGLGIVLSALSAAVHTLVLPRAVNVWLTRWVFLIMRVLFNWRAKMYSTYEQRDSILALYAPTSLLMLPIVWLSLVLLGYMGMFWAVGVRPWGEAFLLSGSSLLTLGYAPVHTLPQTVLSFTEAIIGLGMVALMIAYLPTMYTAFSQRERAVALLEVYAGSPPSAVELIARVHRIHGLRYLEEIWPQWETWFAELEESHTSLSALLFFRSPHPERSWVTAAGTVLDAASLAAAAIDLPPDPRPALCIRSGYLALRQIAGFLRIPYDPDPDPEDPIHVERAEFDEACDRLAGWGVPLKPDRDRAWLDYAGWRVNYDAVLLALAALTMAPVAPWSSDRALLPADAPKSLHRVAIAPE